MVQKQEILKAATLSISAHNVQPFRLDFPAENKIDIYVEEDRLLPIGDPHFKDLRQSLGAFYETLRISLAAQGHELEVLKVLEKPEKNVPMAQFKINDGAKMDRLNFSLNERFSYRGKFQSKVAVPNKIHPGEGFTIEFLTAPQDIQDIAKLYDDVNYRFLTLPGYVEELYSWMRFKPSHARWSRDGLNAESMSLSGVEAKGASIILRASVFGFLAKMGLAKPLVSEAAQIQSASALAVILCDSEKDFDKGRAFMRGWLTLTQQGLFGAPLSLLTDDKNALEIVGKKISTKGKYIVNVLRVGPLPANYKRPASARLPWKELRWKN